MKITIIHPSYGRPQKASIVKEMAMFRSGISYDQINYVVAFDKADPCNKDYQYLLGFGEVNGGTAIKAINETAYNLEAVKELGDIIIVMSDDFDTMPQGWLKKIIEAVKDHPDPEWILKTNDGTQGWILTFPIMSRAMYKRLGYIYYPGYDHMFADTDLSSVGDLMGKIIYRNDILIPHNHYSTHKNSKDAVNEKNDRTWAQGEKLYLERFKNNFNLAPHEITGKIMHKPHLQWISKKLS